MTTAPGYSAAPASGRSPSKLDDAVSRDWVRRVVDVVNGVLRGKMNATLPINLAAGAAKTAIIDARISTFSTLLLQPLTTNAAAALYGAPYVLPSNQNNGSVDLNHVNDANADKTFNLLIIG